MNILINNLAITGVCLFLLGAYFNYREKKLQKIAENKLGEIRERYLAQNAERKAREKKEIDKLKGIVQDLEDKHRQILKEKNAQSTKKEVRADLADDILKKAKERAQEIENVANEEAQKYLEEQRQEVQTKMVDLVMSVSKKVLTKNLSYEDHQDMIEKALLSVEGEVANDESN